jgi:lycopene cyclase domain-containing protein
MDYIYLAALVASIICLGLADYRYKLLLPREPRMLVQYLLIGVCFFLCWDIAGIVLGVFSTNQDWVSGLHIIGPDLPIEEIFFLILFCYSALLSWRLVCSRTS